MSKTWLTYLGIVAIVGSAGCLPTYNSPQAAPQVEDNGPKQGEQTSTEPVAVRPPSLSDSVSVFMEAGDAATLLDKITTEGTPEQAARLHSCMKTKFDSLGQMLKSRGASITLPVIGTTTCPAMVGGATAAQNSDFLYCTGRVTLGLPQYGARLGESPVQTTASATKMHDLFLAASKDILANFATAAACKDGSGAQAQLFNGDNTCNATGVACLIGHVPSTDTLALCSQIVRDAEADASETDKVKAGKKIAIAALLATSGMCE